MYRIIDVKSQNVVEVDKIDFTPIVGNVISISTEDEIAHYWDKTISGVICKVEHQIDITHLSDDKFAHPTTTVILIY